VLLTDRKLGGADTSATAYPLAAAIRKIEKDLFNGNRDYVIISGMQSVDGDTAQVGPMLAAVLDIPYVAWARKLIFGEDAALQVERLLDHGYDAVEVKLPALITVIKEINEPRVPSFKAKLKAKTAAIPVWGPADLGLAEEEVGLSGSFTQVVKVFPPPARGESEVWTGTPEELARRLWQRLKVMTTGEVEA
jgi:electron transfer flavoprotein beta subunit